VTTHSSLTGNVLISQPFPGVLIYFLPFPVNQVWVKYVSEGTTFLMQGNRKTTAVAWSVLMSFHVSG